MGFRYAGLSHHACHDFRQAMNEFCLVEASAARELGPLKVDIAIELRTLEVSITHELYPGERSDHPKRRFR